MQIQTKIGDIFTIRVVITRI